MWTASGSVQPHQSTTIGSYCKSKSAVALSLNVTHNWFDDIRNFSTLECGMVMCLVAPVRQLLMLNFWQRWPLHLHFYVGLSRSSSQRKDRKVSMQRPPPPEGYEGPLPGRIWRYNVPRTFAACTPQGVQRNSHSTSALGSAHRHSTADLCTTSTKYQLIDAEKNIGGQETVLCRR